MSVLDFLSHYSGLLSAAINLGMLCVWVVYLQILVHSYLRQRRSAILITRGSSADDARCLVTNMGAEQIYVTSLIGKFITGEDAYEFTLTDLRELSGEASTDPNASMLQGSLATGESFDIGRFEDIIRHMRRQSDDDDERERIDAFELTVVALYGTEYLPVGARRRFSFPTDTEGRYAIRPDSIQTEQLRSRADRRALLETLRDHL